MRQFLALLFLAPILAHAEDTAALIARGDALDNAHRSREALAVFIEADRADPNKAEILRRISKQFADLMLEESTTEKKRACAETSVTYAQRAVAADPRNAMAHLALSICYGKLCMVTDNKTKIELSKTVHDEALKSIALDPGNDYAYHMLGRWNYELANTNGVLKVIAGIVYGKLPDASNEEAVRFFKKAIAIAPARVLHHVELGRTYLAMGQRNLARESLQQGLRLASREKDDPEAKNRARQALAKL